MHMKLRQLESQKKKKDVLNHVLIIIIIIKVLGYNVQ